PFIEIQKLSDQLTEPLINSVQPDIYNLVQFNASLNELKDILLKLEPGTGYIYINQNQEFPEVRMVSNKIRLEAIPGALIQNDYNIFQSVFFRSQIKE